MDPLLPVVLPTCCGIDVHKKTVTACLLQTGASGAAVSEVRTVRTVTGQLQELAHWLGGAGCRQVALESTGVYGKPVFNVLDNTFLLPGVENQLLQDGLWIRGSQGFGGGTVESQGDHRIAMAFAVAGLKARAPIEILDVANVATSFPGFVDMAHGAGLQIEAL